VIFERIRGRQDRILRRTFRLFRFVPAGSALARDAFRKRSARDNNNTFTQFKAGRSSRGNGIYNFVCSFARLYNSVGKYRPGDRVKEDT